MIRIIIATIIVCLPVIIHGQTIITTEKDTTVKVEYNNGRIWAYRQIGDFIVGMTNNKEKDNYGDYYQIAIFIKNLSNTSALFDPSLITSILTDEHGGTEYMKVYTYEQYMKKIKASQAWSMALVGFSAGLNAGMAGYQTTYTTTYGVNHKPYTQVYTTYNHTAASAANMAATTQIMTLSKLMADDRNSKSQGYLQISTIHPNEGIVGYMNIKRKKGQLMSVNIPVGGQVFSFDWDVTKKKVK